MKLTRRGGGTSFYEAFSDLIFATMAIFVLLMIIFLVQIKTPRDLDDLLQAVAENEQRLGKAKAQLLASLEEFERQSKSKASLEEYNFEVVVAVDTTGSMQWELDLLAETVALVGRILPKMARSVKMGVIAYRKDQQENDRTRVFGLSPLIDEDKDNGASQHSLRRFVNNLKAEPGTAPLESAVDGALKMFSPTSDFTGHQLLMVLGDVGPFEDFYGDQSVDSKNHAQAQAMTQQLNVWVSKSDHRNLLLLFSGEDEIRKAGGEQQQKYIASREFFSDIAEAVGQPDAYTSNPADMIPSLLSALLR